ncbi:gamma-tubulin complex component 6 [Toxorhynchites rutilus septentrionalis]|uniref:gamma-tubulin complex component 6 n=1 Tax=Toxorhynchites rutilus septentrionalis TaxID=329112 RepID=UPI00247985D0|nr:gamma-tubulin complex component 6 [Toxorhynchites rutilus septentrionalis]
MSSDGVYSLIGDLVSAIGQKSCPKAPDVSLKKCKSIAFGILLGKRSAIRRGCVAEPTQSDLEKQLIAEEPIEMLHCHLFGMRLKARYKYQKRRCERMEEVLDRLELHRIGEREGSLEESDKAALQFLLLLRDSVPDGRYVGEGESFFAGDFMPSERLGPYSIFRHEHFLPDVKILRAFSEERSSNPYCFKESGNIISEELSGMMETKNPTGREKCIPRMESTHFSDSMAEMANYQGAFRYNLTKGPMDDDEQLLTSFEIIPGDSDQPVISVSSQRNKIFNFNWENLGNRYVPVENQFASECNSVLHLKALGANQLKKTLDVRVVRNDDFLRDVKLLLNGISSRCFHYDEKNRFVMVGNFTVADLSPLTMRGIVDQFVELGTCFRRLQKMTKKNPFSHAMIFDGFVFKAFCDCVERILCCFRVIVNSYEGRSLIQLQRKVEPMKQQILALAKFCGIHPKYESDKDFPTGSVFLDYLYKEIIHITSSAVASFLLHILKHCCYAYFLLFQQWLFAGQLRDPSGELFIYFVNHYRPKTKHFFDKAFLIRRPAVPGFLKGYEEDILLCGKYTMLLKAFRPTHPIFTLRIPKLEVCLSYTSVGQLKARWLQYVAKARDICGSPVTVCELYERKQREREEFFRLVEANFRRSMDQWRQDQNAEAQELRRRKERRMEELLDQLNEIRISKLSAKRQELELEEKYRQEGLEFENRRLLAENLERERAVESYKELNRMMDRKLEKAEGEVERLKVQLEIGVEQAESSENDFESCAGSMVSVYEDAQKSPMSDGMGAISSEDDNDNTIVENHPKAMTASDIVNCNDVVSEGERNKQRVLGSTLGALLAEDHENANVDAIKETAVAGIRQLTEARKNKLKILSKEFDIVGTHANANVVMSATEERQRNRQRILISDYVSREDDSRETDNPKVARELSALEKNRMKIMSQEYNVILDDHDYKRERKREMYLNIDSDSARNRRRVLDSEYNIFTGQQNFVDTPMSVDSDTVSEDIQLPLITVNDEEPQDINANPIELESNKLKLDTAVAQEKFNESRFGIPDTALLAQETPESALNTAGLQAKQGFEFPLARRSCSPLGLESEGDFEEDEIYKEFMEAMKKRDLNLCELAQVSDDIGSISELRDLDSELKSVDVLTVTRFLQSSLVIPLKAHLEIVNSEIMKMCLNDLDLLGQFESLRNYFLLMDGEFSCYVCDNIFIMLEEVRSPDELLNYQTLHTILDSALCSSAAGADKNADRLSFSVEQIPERFDLYHPNVVSMLNLSYRVDWPLNLILNPETIDQYANIFKYLVKVRRVSFVLGKSFQLLKESFKQFGKRILTSPQYSRVQLISHKLSHLVNALKNYITSSALLASWESFRKDLESAASMEDLYRKHTHYIKRILFLCLLNKKSVEFYNNMEEIFKVVLRFYKHLKSKSWRPRDKLNPSSPLVHPKYDQILNDESDFEKLIKYTIYLGNKMYDYGYQKEIHEFISVININGYYTSSAEEETN